MTVTGKQVSLSGGSFSLSAGYWVVAPAQSDLIFQHDFENPTP